MPTVGVIFLSKKNFMLFLKGLLSLHSNMCVLDDVTAILDSDTREACSLICGNLSGNARFDALVKTIMRCKLLDKITCRQHRQPCCAFPSVDIAVVTSECKVWALLLLQSLHITAYTTVSDSMFTNT